MVPFSFVWTRPRGPTSFRVHMLKWVDSIPRLSEHVTMMSPVTASLIVRRKGSTRERSSPDVLPSPHLSRDVNLCAPANTTASYGFGFVMSTSTKPAASLGRDSGGRS